MSSARSDTILPGAVLGILGSGQLGRMLAMAARRLGYRVHVFSPEPDSPAGQVADVEQVGAYDDVEAVRGFARRVDVVTFEFENVSSVATAAAEEVTRVRPAGRVLHVTQHRLREKTFLRESGIPTTPFRAIGTWPSMQEAVAALGLPAVLKTASFGYDGKGQRKLERREDIEPAFQGLRGAEGILEAWVSFEREVSVVAARSPDGAFAAYPVFENAHARHILDVTCAPARLSEAQAAEAVALARRIVEGLDVVGLLTVEMFVGRDGRLLVNELAPRTHNSGHLTLDACVTCQFEQQVRAVCGLPLGETRLRSPAAMANLLGDWWEGGEPEWCAALLDPGVKLHLYGKAAARVGRKMGHLTVAAETVDEARSRVMAARERLRTVPDAAASI